MLARALADLVLLVHAFFLIFVLAGGLLVFRRPRLAWIHVPVFLYGAAVEFGGWVCPLTPLENRLRRMGGEAGYRGGFIEHYLLPLVYPEGLTREIQIGLGTGVLVLNLGLYAWILLRKR